MKVSIEKSPVQFKVGVGDVLQFNHNGTNGDHGFYLVCKEQRTGYFIMSLSGKKSRIVFYDTLSELVDRHRGSIANVFPADEFQITLERI